MTAWPPRRGPLETPGVVAGETQLATQSPPRAAPYPRTCRRVARNSRVMSLPLRSEEHMSELQSRTLISYAVFCLKKKKRRLNTNIEFLYCNKNFNKKQKKNY